MQTFAAVTTNPLEVTFISVMTAILFLASIVGVLSWMFRLPKETERTRTVAKATRSVSKLTRILVPIVDPEIQTVNEASVRYNKEYEKTLYSQLQSPGGTRVVKGRQNDGAD